MWQANALGKYSDQSGEQTSGVNWLRGYPVSDANGQLTPGERIRRTGGKLRGQSRPGRSTALCSAELG